MVKKFIDIYTELIEECRSNGLPVKMWCQQAQITPSTYYR